MIGDIGLGELMVIAVVAIIVFGPDKLPELARQAGAILRKLRDFARSARDELRDELGDEYKDLELTDLDPRRIVRRQIEDAMRDDPDEVLHGDPDDRGSRPGQRPLAAGELPPYDPDAT